MGLQGVTNRLQGVTGGYKKYRELRGGVKKGHKKSQGVTGG